MNANGICGNLRLSLAVFPSTIPMIHWIETSLLFGFSIDLSAV